MCDVLMRKIRNDDAQLFAMNLPIIGDIDSLELTTDRRQQRSEQDYFEPVYEPILVSTRVCSTGH